MILKEKPLVVDLDGTLIHSEIMYECLLRVFRDNPFEILRIPFLLAKGEPLLKQHLASCTEIDPKTLPYNEELLEWLKQQRDEGRRLVLSTASERSIADLISDHLSIFDEVIASNGVSNTTKEHKAAALVQRFDHLGYDYAGNSHRDLLVWSHAYRAIIVNGSGDLVKRAKYVTTVERVFPKRNIGLSTWRQFLRIHQWLKNLLLFVPLVAAHNLGNWAAWTFLLLAFVAFSFCASSVHIINDLVDLESDRLHSTKRNRPFASGTVPVWIGLLVAPLLLIISLGAASFVGTHFLALLTFYFAVTCAYSWVIKRLMLIDCLTLAILYTLRIIAGAAAVGSSVSFWLLAFSVFLFLSLAFVKRYAEMEIQLINRKDRVHGRGYLTTDAPLIQTMGIVSGYSSVLVLAFYLNSDAVIKLYAAPELIWGAVPVMLFWVSWMWMQAHRGKMHDDPLVFAFTDRASLYAAAVFAAILLAGTVGVSW